MSKLYKITHVTSVHQRYDTRIFLKMCISLSKNINFEVNLIVADGYRNEINKGINIYDVGVNEGGRFSRMIKTVRKVFNKSKELDSDIYHLHDPELIPMGIKLKKLGKKVIFDCHEDFLKQLLNKPYFNGLTAIIFSKIFMIYEKKTLKNFDIIITATDFIRDRYLKINKNTFVINNYPIINKSKSFKDWKSKENKICYVGGIDKSRGIYELIEAMSYTNEVILTLAGNFKEKKDRINLVQHKSWDKVIELGYIDKPRVLKVYQESKIGIVTLHPQINYIDSLPVKMFEYMEASIPVIASDFPVWKSIIEQNNCGICVDPLNPKAVSDAIKYLFENENISQIMGENGRNAILDFYNWSIEELKLLNLYKKITNSN